MSEYLPLIAPLKEICLSAGEKIMEIYSDNSSWGVEIKDDKSPLTKADKEANQIIVEGLQRLPLQLPIISEEGKDVSFQERRHWNQFWLVDPLDGTKEFIKRNGQFTVNIALVANQSPILGFIYAPATKELFYGIRGVGAFKAFENGQDLAIHVSKRLDQWIAVGSSSHATDEDKVHFGNYPVASTIQSGSSLKFCRVAEGAADIYLRTGPTMEWDTAAGQSIAESAGARMHQLDGTPFLYNKENLLNPGFICVH